jgi:hypothetical protein
VTSSDAAMLVDALTTYYKTHPSLTQENIEGRIHVTKWYDNAGMIKIYLQNNIYDVLVSVKRDISQIKLNRVYNLNPLSETVFYEVAILHIDTPEYREDHEELVDKMVDLTQRFFRQQPWFGVERGSKNASYTVKQQRVLTTTITVYKLNENLKS